VSLAVLLPIDRARIARALARRARYKYVTPRVEREGPGWKVISPNCSRNVDPDVVPANAGQWLLHARDHAQGCWVLKAAGLRLDEALSRLCADPLREFWQ
jgi:hypothetical protein